MRVKLWIAGLIVVLAMTSFTCKEEPGGVSPPKEPEAKREYTWSIDTIQYPTSYQTLMTGMYGTGDSNVYIVGFTSVAAAKMYRYNGKKWNVVPLTVQEGGPIQKLQLEDIHGSGPNNIWAVGEESFLASSNPYTFLDSSMVVHFDGVRWSEVKIPCRGPILYAVWVVSPNCVWASGDNGYVVNYNGSTWKKFELPKKALCSSITALSASEVYVIGHVGDAVFPIDSSGSFLFKYDGTTWTCIDSIMRTPNAPPSHLGSTVYSAYGRVYNLGISLYERVDNIWRLLLDADVGHMYQHGINQMIAVGSSVYHYNGKDWKEIYQIPQPLRGGRCFSTPNQIFILYQDGFKTYVIHGK